MSGLLYLLIFISGLFIGSFLNVVSDRILSKKSIIFGRSICDYCKKALTARELVPFFSFVAQKGKCRKCAKKLSYYYPLSELITGIVFVSLAKHLNVLSLEQDIFAWIVLGYFLIVSCFFIVLLLTDLKYTMLPNKVVYTAIIFVTVFLLFSFIYTVWSSHNQLANDSFGVYLIKSGYWKLQMVHLIKSNVLTIFSALAIGVFFWFLTLIKDGKAMGGGDVKLAFLIGMFNGFPNNVLAIFLGFFSGALISLLLIAFGKKTMKDTIPFGPFLILGSYIALLWGSQIMNWYFDLFN